MPNQPLLLPTPQNLEFTNGIINFKDITQILLDADHHSELIFSARRLRAALEAFFHINLDISSTDGSADVQFAIILRLDLHATNHLQGYRINITPSRILVDARDARGIFYGCCTLIQLIQYYSFSSDVIKNLPGNSLPCLEIQDWSDFPNRGVMLDISRDKVPTMDTLYSLVDMLASWKINQLQLYTEHTFAYLHHPDVWAEASPFTGEEILNLDAYCRERFIELVPNQNSFGHLERWLKLPRYLPLAEAPDGYFDPSGNHYPASTLCPVDPASLTFLQGLYDELLPYFSSQQFNVGCDETFDLGQGRSKTESERVGVGRVYLDFLLKIYREVTRRGFRFQFWGDIVMDHPELVEELPKDGIALEWGYEAHHPFDQHGEKFAQSGLPFYVCPGTSSWNSIAGRTDNCLQNLDNAARNGLKYGAIGYLITDWGDNGHWQCLPVSFLGFAAGAAYSWAYQANKDLELQDALNLYAFIDPSGNLGKLFYELGNVYRQVGIEPHNSSLLFSILQNPLQDWEKLMEPETGAQKFHLTLEIIEQIAVAKSTTNSLRSDKDLLAVEIELTLDLLRHACRRACYGFGSSEFSQEFLYTDIDRIIANYQSVWMSRNRPGGLIDSSTHFDVAKSEYHSS